MGQGGREGAHWYRGSCRFLSRALLEEMALVIVGSPAQNCMSGWGRDVSGLHNTRSQAGLVVKADLSCWCHPATWVSPHEGGESQVCGHKKASRAGLRVVGDEVLLAGAAWPSWNSS